MAPRQKREELTVLSDNPGYRRYADYEPDSARETGVYFQNRHPGGPLVPHHYVPPFLSRQFFRFAIGFFKSPSDNPVFMREWRRHLRRVRGLFVGMLIGAFLLALFSMLGIFVLIALRQTKTIVPGELGALAFFFIPTFAASWLGFFLGLKSSSMIWNHATLEELSLTPLHPQEISFGHLLGGVLPFSFPLLMMLPAMGLVSFDLFLRESILGPRAFHAFFGMFFWFPFNVVGSVLATAALSQALSFRSSSLAKPIIAWFAVTILIIGPVMLYALLSWPYTFSVGGPVLFGVKLLIAGAFLQNLAIRVAQDQNTS